MAAALARREAILAALAELQPPAQFDESALISFVATRQRLVDELQAIGAEHLGPLSKVELYLRATAAAAAETAVQMIGDAQAGILSTMGRYRQAQRQVRDYGNDDNTPASMIDRKG